MTMFCLLKAAVFGAELEEQFVPAMLPAPPVVVKCTQELEARAKITGKSYSIMALKGSHGYQIHS